MLNGLKVWPVSEMVTYGIHIYLKYKKIKINDIKL
jgi:hypothetical protein